MGPPEIARLLAHLETVGMLHPVATVLDGNGVSHAGELKSYASELLVLTDPVTKRSSHIQLATAQTVRVSALGRPSETFGEALSDDETMVP